MKKCKLYQCLCLDSCQAQGFPASSPNAHGAETDDRHVKIVKGTANKAMKGEESLKETCFKTGVGKMITLKQMMKKRNS